MKQDYDYDQLFPGRFIKSGEFKGKDATLTIRDVDLEEMEDRKKGVVVKCIVSFVETKKQLVLNRTNAECIKGMFDRRVKAWIGKRITFYPTTVQAFGSPKLAIRVRGSPDITKDSQIMCKVGRDEPFPLTMKKTGAKPANGKALADPPPDAPAGVDDSGAPWNEETGEVLA